MMGISPRGAAGADSDALPQAGREYVRHSPSAHEADGKKVRVGNPNLVPNFVPNLKDADAASGKESSGDALETPAVTQKNGEAGKPAADDNLTDTDSRGSASLADARKSVTPEEAERRWFEFWKRK